METLYDWRLIKQEDGGRYYLLETIREYGGLMLDENGKDFGLDRYILSQEHANYYLKTAQSSEDPWPEIAQEFDNIAQGANWIADQLNIPKDYSRYLNWLSEQGVAYKGIQNSVIQLAYDYAFALDGYIYRRSVQEGLRWLLAGVCACQELGEEKAEANFYNEIGLRYYSQGNYQEALKWYKKSVEIKEKIGDQAGLATTYNNIAGIHYAQGNYQEALKWYKKSIEIKEKIGDQAGLATTYNNIGSIYDSQGNYQEALKWYEKSKEILKRIGDRHHLAMSLQNIGLLYQDIGKKDIAKQALKESYELFFQLNLKSEADKVKQILDSLYSKSR